MAMVEWHHVINVARDSGRKRFGSDEPAYVHFFLAEVRDAHEAQEVFASLKAAYPAPAFSVTVRRVECVGVVPDWA